MAGISRRDGYLISCSTNEVIARQIKNRFSESRPREGAVWEIRPKRRHDPVCLGDGIISIHEIYNRRVAGRRKQQLTAGWGVRIDRQTARRSLRWSTTNIQENRDRATRHGDLSKRPYASNCIHFCGCWHLLILSTE